jgi:NADH-quinone oxidoreductase subunit K
VEVLNMHVGLSHFLIVGAILFAAGLYCILTRRNAIGVLLGVELILNGANVNLAAFSHYSAGELGGQIFALFAIVLAAAEAAVALAIVLAIYRTFHESIDMEDATLLKG